MAESMKRAQLIDYAIILLSVIPLALPYLMSPLPTVDWPGDFSWNTGAATYMLQEIRKGHFLIIWKTPASLPMSLLDPQLYQLLSTFILLLTDDLWFSLKMHQVIQTMICGLSMYVFAYRMTRKRIASLSSAVFYMYTPFFLWHLTTHYITTWAYALAPLSLLTMHFAVDKNEAKYAILAGMLFAATALLSHVEQIYYWGLFLVLFFIAFSLVKVFQAVDKKRTLINIGKTFIIILTVTLLLTAYFLIPSMTFYPPPFVSAAYELEASQYVAWERSIFSNIVITALARIPSEGFYWNPQWFWYGCMPIFFWTALLATLALVIGKPQKIDYIILIISIISIIFALGVYSPLFQFLIEILPYSNMIKHPGRFLSFVCLAFAYLAGISVNAIVERIEMKRTKILLCLACVFLGLSLSFSSFSAFIIVLLSTSLLLLFVHKKWIIVILATILLIMPSYYYVFHSTSARIGVSPFETAPWPISEDITRTRDWLDQTLWEEEENYRVLDFSSNPYGPSAFGTTSKFIHRALVNGYDLALRFYKTSYFAKLLGTLNVKYIIVSSDMPWMPGDFADALQSSGDFDIAYKDGRYTVLRNKYALLRIWPARGALFIGGINAFAFYGLDSYNQNTNWILVNAIQNCKSLNFSEKLGLLEKMDILLFHDSDLIDFKMLLLDSRFYIEPYKFASDDWTTTKRSSHHMLFNDPAYANSIGGQPIYSEYMIKTSKETALEVPFTVANNEVYDVFIRILGNTPLHRETDIISVSVDGNTIDDYIDAQEFAGFRWIHIGSVELENGEHRLKLKTQGKGTTYLDSIIIVPKDVYDDFSKRVEMDIPAKATILYLLEPQQYFRHLYGNFTLLCDALSGYSFETSYLGLDSNASIETEIMVPRDGDYWLSLRMRDCPSFDGRLLIHIDNELIGSATAVAEMDEQWVFKSFQLKLSKGKHKIALSSAYGNSGIDLIYLLEGSLNFDELFNKPLNVEINYIEKSPETLAVDVYTSESFFLVCVETYTNGWIASIKNKMSSPLGGNYQMNVFYLEDIGQYSVKITYRNTPQLFAVYITLATFIALVAYLAWTTFQDRRRRPPKKPLAKS